MKKIANKKLQLQRNTLRLLSHEVLPSIGGGFDGATSTNCSFDPNHCGSTGPTGECPRDRG